MVRARTMQRFGEFDLEGVFGLRMRVAEGGFGGAAEGGCVGGVVQQGGLRLVRAPGFGADAAEGDAGVGDLAAGGPGDDGGGGEGELVGGAVAELEVEGLGAGAAEGG